MKNAALTLLAVLFVSSLAFAGAQKGDFVADVKVEGWKLNEGTGTRSAIVFVKFDKPFDATPTVMLSVTGQSAVAGKGGEINIAVASDKVSRDGFVIKVTTWGDTKLVAVYGSWIALDGK